MLPDPLIRSLFSTSGNITQRTKVSSSPNAVNMENFGEDFQAGPESVSTGSETSQAKFQVRRSGPPGYRLLQVACDM